jgi:hypothetical protein
MMNTRMKLATAVAAVGLTCAWMAQADESNCSSEGKYNDPETAQAEPVTKSGDDSKEGMNTTTSGDPELLAPGTRWLDYEVHEGKTKMSFRIKEGGTLKFKNKSPDKILRIKSDAKRPPFDVPDSSKPQWEFTVDRKSSLSVDIDEAYVHGDCFTYSSQIGESTAEDPIVIIE